MVAITPVGMNPTGQFVISQPGDTFNNMAAVANTDSYNDLIDKPTSLTPTTSSLTLALVGTGATGTQISSTNNSMVSCTVSASSTVSALLLGATSSSVITMKKCATNSATEGDWTSIANVSNSQTLTGALSLSSIQLTTGQMTTQLPSSWFVKLVNSGTGTHTESYTSGEKTIYG